VTPLFLKSKKNAVTVHTWEDREARYKIEEYKRKFREIENKSNR